MKLILLCPASTHYDIYIHNSVILQYSSGNLDDFHANKCLFKAPGAMSWFRQTCCVLLKISVAPPHLATFPPPTEGHIGYKCGFYLTTISIYLVSMKIMNAKMPPKRTKTEIVFDSIATLTISKEFPIDMKTSQSGD